MSAARAESHYLRLVECRAILGGERDPMRAIWDEGATARDRRFLMAMGGIAQDRIAGRSGFCWVDLSVNDRVAIVGGLRKFKAWAARL